MASTAISLKNVSIAYGDTKALDDVTLEIPAGKIVGVLGPSGAGKTTLLRVIVGRHIVRQGRVTVFDQPAGAVSLRGQVGYMPQSPSLYPDLTVVENLNYFAAMLGLSKEAVAQRLKEVDLTAQAKQLVSTLSGGQRSRASLAVALLGRPELLVLDEPTVGVDPVLRQQLWEIFHAIATKGVTLLISSHVMDEASRCDDLLLIRNGQVLAHDTPNNLCQQTETGSVEQAFLQLVETQA